MKLSERLAALQRQREAAVKAMEGFVQKSADEGRAMDDTEQDAFDEKKAEIDSIDKQIDSIEVMMKTLEKAAPETRSTTGSVVEVPNGRISTQRNLPKGTAFTRYAMALAAGKGNTMASAEIAKNLWSKSTPEVETIIRAAVAAGTTTDTTWAAPLAQYNDMAAEFIELLRPETFMGRMTGFRNVPFMVRMPRQTSGASAGWVGQGAPKPLSKPGFDSVTIPHTKVAVIVAITEELARFSSPSAEATVRQDLVETISQFLDVQLVSPSVSAVADVSPASITNGAQSYISTGSTVAQVTNDLNLAMTYMATNNINQRNRYWLLHPRTANYLMTLRTSQDVYAFRDEMSRGVLLGIPFLQSTNMPLFDQGSPTASPTSLETYIVLVEASEIFVADDNEVMLDVSREASLQMVDNPQAGAQSLVSLWQNNLIGIRAERFIYWARRRPQSVVYIRQVAY
jgi:HK97 family phage major capsid protein